MKCSVHAAKIILHDKKSVKGAMKQSTLLGNLRISLPICRLGFIPPIFYFPLFTSLFFLFAGCEEIASQFLSQEIDGQALLLLKEEHLMSTMNIKLGPALKICAHINNLRD